MSIMTEISKTTRSLDLQERELLDLEQAARSKAEAIRLEKEKKARQEQTLAETRERLLRQMQDLSPAALVEILIEEGITCLGDGLVTAADLIIEAADIFERSFWTTGAEVRDTGQRFESEADLLACVPNDLKHFVAKMPGGTFAAVTGLCSIGAIGLVRSMKAKTDDLNLGFSDLFHIDWTTRLATEAVAHAMRETVYAQSGSNPECWLGQVAPDSIVKANDNLLDKESVIAAFRTAASSPILTADSLWSLRDPYSGTRRDLALTQEQAEDWAYRLNAGDYGFSAFADFARRWYGTGANGWEAVEVTTKAAYDRNRAEMAASL